MKSRRHELNNLFSSPSKNIVSNKISPVREKLVPMQSEKADNSLIQKQLAGVKSNKYENRVGDTHINYPIHQRNSRMKASNATPAYKRTKKLSREESVLDDFGNKIHNSGVKNLNYTFEGQRTFENIPKSLLGSNNAKESNYRKENNGKFIF
jgi:hypothetical protein